MTTVGNFSFFPSTHQTLPSSPMKVPTLIRCFASLTLLTFSTTLSAEVKLPPVIGAGMVLQRDLPVPIWGWAEAGEKVTVSFGGQAS